LLETSGGQFKGQGQSIKAGTDGNNGGGVRFRDLKVGFDVSSSLDEESGLLHTGSGFHGQGGV